MEKCASESSCPDPWVSCHCTSNGWPLSLRLLSPQARRELPTWNVVMGKSEEGLNTSSRNFNSDSRGSGKRQQLMAVIKGLTSGCSRYSMMSSAGRTSNAFELGMTKAEVKVEDSRAAAFRRPRLGANLLYFRREVRRPVHMRGMGRERRKRLPARAMCQCW